VERGILEETPIEAIFKGGFQYFTNYGGKYNRLWTLFFGLGMRMKEIHVQKYDPQSIEDIEKYYQRLEYK